MDLVGVVTTMTTEQIGNMNEQEVKKLYDALISKGYSVQDIGDEQRFTQKMSDANNRKQLYDYVSARGNFRIGDYDSYERRLTGGKTSTPQSPSPSPSPSDTTYPDEVVRRHASPSNGPGNYKDLSQINTEYQQEQRQRQGLTDMGITPLVDRAEAARKQQVLPPVFEREVSIDADGNRVSTPKLVPGFDAEGHMAPGGVYRDALTGKTYDPQDPNVQQQVQKATRTTPIDLKQANRQQVASLSQSIDDALLQARGESVRMYTDAHQKAAKQGLGASLMLAASETAGAADPIDMQFMQLRRLLNAGYTGTEEGEQLARRISDLETAQRSMRDARRIISEADHNAKEGTFGKWLESSFAGGAARGFGQKLFDIDTWDMGVSDMQDAGNLLLALRAFDSGKPLTESQQAMLDAKAVELATNAYFGSYVGRGYKAGEVTAESIPFMIEMCLNPAAGTGQAAENMLVRYALKRFGKQAVKQNAKKYVAAKVATRVVGDVAGSAAMAATTGAIGVGADTMDRMNGQVQTDTDADGQTVFAGHDEGEDFGTAFGKAFAARTIENYSEMVGEYFAPVLGVGSQYVRKGMGKIGLESVSKFMDDVAMSDVGRLVTDFEKHAKWNGVIGEYAEEVAGGIMNALVVGDQTLDTNPDTGVFTLDNNIDTFLGVSLMGGFMSAVKTAGYRTPKYRARQDMKATDDAAAAVFANQDTWGEIRNTLAFGEDEAVKAKLAEVMTNGDFTPEQKAAALKYAQAVENYRGILRGENKRREEGAADPTQTDAETSFDNGYSLESDQEMNDAKNMLDFQRSRIGDFVTDDMLANLDSDPVGALNGILASDAWTDEEKQAATDYVNAKATYDGMIQHVQDDMQSRMTAAISMVNARVHPDGQIHPATMKVDDRKVYVIGGNVVMNEDGTMVDHENSDESIIIRDAETGNIEFADPRDVLSVDEALDAAQEKQAAQDAIRQEYAQQAADKIDGVLQFNDGDTYTVTDEQGQQHTVVVVPNGTANSQGQILQAGEGEALVSVDGAEPAPMSREDIQGMVDATNLARLQQFEQERAERRAAEVAAEREANRPDYHMNDNVTLQVEGGNVRGTIVSDANEDGLYEVYTERPIGGKKINLFSRDELDGMLVEHNGNTSAPNTEAQTTDGAAQMTVDVEPHTQNDENYAQNPSENIREEVDDADETAEGTTAETEDAMPMIGEGEDAEPDFAAVTPARAHTYIYKESGLSRDEANQFVDANKKVADNALQKLQKKPPKMTPSLAKYNREKAEWQQKVDNAQAQADYWQAVKAEQQKALQAEQEARAATQAAATDQAILDEEQRQAEVLRKREEQERLGSNNVSAEITEKWNAAPKIDGVRNEIVLANGEKVAGHYVLVESGAATPSHNPVAGFVKNEGFPIDENEQSVNDRDYERDQDAQAITRNIADNYDSRALQTPVVVSNDGVVLSGNGRTMAGELAAQNGTDGAYIEHLQKYGQQYGFTADQVNSMEHPRVLFVPDAAMPYTTDTFAKFNQQEMKGQSKTEQAVKLGKIVDDETFGRIIRSINAYDTLGDFYTDTEAATNAINELRSVGAISQAQYAEMFDGESISAQGKEILENMLIGKAFESNPDAVREITAYKGIRQSVISALAEISNNLILGPDYSLESELAEAIDLVYRARQAGYKAGEAVSGFALQGNLFEFDEGATVADYTNATVMMIADVLNDNRVTRLKKFLAIYNHTAHESATGQMDIFSGSLKSKEEIIDEVKQLFNYGTNEEQQSALERARQQRTASATAGQQGGSESLEQDGTGSDGDEGNYVAPSADVAEKKNSALDNTTDTGKASERGKRNDTAAPQSTVSAGKGNDNSGTAQEKTKKSSIQGLEGYTDDEVLSLVRSDIEEKLADAGIDGVTINGMAIHGSRKRGDARVDSDLDVVVEYDGDFSEDALFDILNEKPLEIEGIRIDINPITPGKSGTLKQYMERSRKYDSELTAAIREAERNTDTAPTEGQKEAGNYKKGHVKIDGFDISIENPKGSKRSGIDENGQPWSVTMQNTYGYIRGTEGVDGDHIDVFLSDHLDDWNGVVYVVDQVDQMSIFDEHKVMYGFNSIEEARAAYLSNYGEGWQGLGAITGVSKEEFKKWVDSSHRKTKPFSEYRSVNAIGDTQLGEGAAGMSEEQAYALVESMKTHAVQAPVVEITDENWREKVSTPIGEVKMGANQREKLFVRGREQQYGMLIETLENPDIVLEEADREENMFHERPSTYLFIKTFQKSDGSKYVHFESVTVQQDGMEVSVSSHIIRENQLRNKVKSDRLLYKATALDEPAHSSAEQPTNEGSSLSSAGKGTNNSSSEQEKTEEISNQRDEADIKESVKRNGEVTGALTVHLNNIGVDVSSDLSEYRDARKKAKSDRSSNGKIREMRSSDGQVYGFTYRGKIYLDPRKLNAELPLHEYAHLWCEAFRKLNAEGWKSLVETMKQDTDGWDLIKRRYPDLKTDEDVAEELIAEFSGKRGSEKLRAELERMSQRDTEYSSRWGNIYRNISKAIQDFWKNVGDFLQIEYKNPSEVYDQVLKDFADKVNPRKRVEAYLKQRNSDYMQAVENGDVKRASEIFNEALSEEIGNGMTPFISVANYRDVRGLARKVKSRDPKVIERAAELMAPLIPQNAVLVPAPSHTGDATDMLDLANAIARITGSDVADVLKSEPRESQYKSKKEKGRPITSADMGITLTGELPEGKMPVVIDNVIDSGNTAEACVKTIGKGLVVSLGNSVDNYGHAATLRSGEAVEIDRKGRVVPLDKRFDTNSRYVGRPSSPMMAREREGEDFSRRTYEESVAASRREGYTKKQHDAWIRRQERMGRERIAGLIDKLHLTDRVTVLETAEGLTGRRAKAKGWFDPNTGKIVIVLSNHRSIDDILSTIQHEGVAHFGLRELFGENFDRFLYNVYEHADADVRQHIVELAKKHGWDFGKATEEYLAQLAEDTDFEHAFSTGWWSKIKTYFLDMLHDIIGDYNGSSLSDNELRYLLWRSYENLAEPGRYRNPFSEAADISMQMHLGVGDFDGRPHKNESENGESVAAEEDTNLLFREDEFSTRDRVTARQEYERMVSSGLYGFQEAVQDSMLGLRELYKSILKDSNPSVRIEDVADFENAYLAENRMSSINMAEQHEYYLQHMIPLLQEIGRLVGSNQDARQAMTDYMMAKHGLERNEVMAQRDFDAYKKEHPDGTKTIDHFRKRDYSGLTALTGESKVSNAEAAARKMVSDYETLHDTTALWDRVREATQATLEKIYKSGLMDQELYEQIRDMYAYYIPLRGWDETTSDEVYGYLTSRDGLFGGSPIKRAEGRSSKADDPIATIELMADDAIRQGNRNLMKQHFLNFVLNNPSDLVSVNDLWLQYDATTDEWVPVFADVETGDSAAEIERKVNAFEEKMRQLAESDPDHYKHGKDAQGIPYKVVKGNLKEHQVLVKRGGRTYVLTINGNPRAAQALNGLTNPDVNIDGVVGNMLKLWERINRQLSAFYTTRNPDFVVSNFLRDMLYSNCMTWVKESPRYARRFHKNFGRFNPVTMRRLLGKWDAGTLDVNNYYEKMFRQFMLNGGETGYTSVRDIERHKKEISDELKKMESPSRKAWYVLGKQLDLMNRSVENCARFAAFVTSREMGRTIGRSIYDAKEVSINFNKKGAGGKMINTKGQDRNILKLLTNPKTYFSKEDRAELLAQTGSYISGGGRIAFIFWNPGVQGLTNFGRAGNRNTAKALGGAATLFALGYVIPLLASLVGGGDGDDDDENAYYNLPEYVRRSNICFRWGNQWIAIPLPIEFRSIYGLGELAYGVISGNEYYNGKELTYQIMSQVSQILPLDMLEGGGGVSPFIPSGVKPYVEAYILNKSWTGLPVYKDTPWNQNDPEWTKAYKNADKTLVGVTRWLNESSGGDDFKKGAIDINPAKLEYLLNGVFGGYASTADKLKKMGETVIGERDFDWSNMLLANRVVKTGDERTAYRKLQNEYYKYKQEYEETKRLLRKYENADDEGIAGMAEKIDFLYNSKEYPRYEIFDDYESDINDLREELKEAVDDNERKEIDAEMYELMRELIDKLHVVK